MAEKNGLVDNEKRNCVFDFYTLALPRNTNTMMKKKMCRVE